ncbi:hypothetical protein KoPa4_00066 [Pseudomonas phage vB_PpuM-KoPa-4]|uniref:Uncharacterized protein n=1 Tax=Pseudomonas phage vB_PpuM-KoPa-4 TaxID=3132618 RepID=A0AAX4MYS6_9CAUD
MNKKLGAGTAKQLSLQTAKIMESRYRDEIVTLSGEVCELQYKADAYDALMTHGVENWEGYSDAMADLAGGGDIK